MWKEAVAVYADRLTTSMHGFGTVSLPDEIRIGPSTMKVLGC
jgi:hypothetical protein